MPARGANSAQLGRVFPIEPRLDRLVSAVRSSPCTVALARRTGQLYRMPSGNVRTHAYDVRCSVVTWTYWNQSGCMRKLQGRRKWEEGAATLQDTEFQRRLSFSQI